MPTSLKLPNDTCHAKVSGSQTIATCRDCLKNPRDKSATSSFASEKTGKSATSQTNQQGRHEFVADLSRTSRVSRHNGIWA